MTGGEKQATTLAADVLPSGPIMAVHATGRRKLWELDPASHCSIIGTCLSPEDLNRLRRKAGLPLAPDVEDFDVHGYFVTRSRNLSPLSKLVHKTLDRKYAKEIARFRRAGSAEELWGLWREGMRSGNVAGAYWALLTHKGAPRPMCIRAHNEVHMLSHLMGKASREDLKRVCQLEAVCAELSERLLKMRARSDALLRERENRIRALEIQLAAAAYAHQPELRDRQAVKQSERLSRLQARFATLERRLKVERARARAAESRLHEREEQGGPRPSTLSKRLAGLHPDNETGIDTPQADGERNGVDLCGRALLYVGGYPQLMPHLRTHVERMQGALLHHDGGFELQTGSLVGLVSQVDAVFCPVCCVSHEACWRVKDICKRQGKPLILLRSAGLTGFLSALRKMQ